MKSLQRPSVGFDFFRAAQHPHLEDCVVIMKTGSYKARVVTFSICDDQACSLRGDRPYHLLAKHAYTNVQRGNATAISHAWGEFSRAKRQVGHYPDNKPVMLELGEEWDVDGLITTLCDLCSPIPEKNLGFGSTFCWIDQLCINQDDVEEVRTTLSKIPEMYKTFNVIALLPGDRCECMSKRLEEVAEAVEKLDTEFSQNNSTDLEERIIAEYGLDFAQNSLCTNILGLYGWATRLWTRQETLYAERIRAIWTGNDDVKCNRISAKDRHYFFMGQKRKLGLWQRAVNWAAKQAVYLQYGKDMEVTERIAWRNLAEVEDGDDSDPPEDANNSKLKQLWLQRFGAMAMSLFADEDLPRTTFAEGFEVEFITKAFRNIVNIIQDWRRIHEKDPPGCIEMTDPLSLRGTLMTYSFLCGDTLQADMAWPSSDSEDFHHLEIFLADLQRLKVDRRGASDPRDYVLALWINCPKYEVPQNYWEMSPAMLLEDANQQLERKFSVSLGSNAPAGLFDLHDRQASWKPTHYLDRVRIQDSGDFYAALAPGYALLKHGSPVLEVTRKDSDDNPILLPGMQSSFFSAMDYKSKFRKSSQGKEALCFIFECWAYWPSFVSRKCSASNMMQDAHTMDITESLTRWVINLLGRGHGDMDGSSSSKDDARNRWGTTWNLTQESNGAPAPIAAHANDKTSPSPDFFKAFDQRPGMKIVYSYHHDVLFRLVCFILGLDGGAAHASGLRLIIKTSPPMIGLSKVNFDAKQDFKTRTLCFRACIDDCEPMLAYEVADHGDNDDKSRTSKSGYRVVGVWIPSLAIPPTDLCSDMFLGLGRCGLIEILNGEISYKAPEEGAPAPSISQRL